MTLFHFVYNEHTRTPNLRPMTAEVQSHWQQSRVSSVADPDCIGLDIYRWENEGGALIGDKQSAAAALIRKDNLQRTHRLCN